MMENSKTIYPFLVLIFASWIIELVMGWKVIEWWWGTAWYAWDSPGSQSMADDLISLGQMLSSARSGAQTVSVHATSAGVVRVVFALFVGSACAQRDLEWLAASSQKALEPGSQIPDRPGEQAIGNSVCNHCSQRHAGGRQTRKVAGGRWAWS